MGWAQLDAVEAEGFIDGLLFEEGMGGEEEGNQEQALIPGGTPTMATEYDRYCHL